jgi:hypothetical protein
MTYHGPSLALQVDQHENLHQDLWVMQRELKSRSKLQQENLKQDLLDCPTSVIISSCLESLESKPGKLLPYNYLFIIVSGS